ncbi:hypothetical protein IWZ00DRAFT_363698 [Phyllosticta capitalensis]
MMALRFAMLLYATAVVSVCPDHTHPFALPLSWRIAQTHELHSSCTAPHHNGRRSHLPKAKAAGWTKAGQPKDLSPCDTTQTGVGCLLCAMPKPRDRLSTRTESCMPTYTGK